MFGSGVAGKVGFCKSPLTPLWQEGKLSVGATLVKYQQRLSCTRQRFPVNRNHDI